MKTAKLTVTFLACAAAIPAFAQNTTDSRCGSTNYDSSRNMYTITNPAPVTATQQCFVTVVPKQSWNGGMPDLSTSQLVEGNYEITLSGGGGGGGGGAGVDTERGRFHRIDDSADDTERGRFRRTDDSARDAAERARYSRSESGAGDGGDGGYSAIPVTNVRYLNPGVYRLTIGSGGQGGTAGLSGEHVVRSGGRGADCAPTSLSNANTGETVAGYSRAEYWDGTYPLVALGTYGGTPATSGERGAKGGDGVGGEQARSGQQGGNGFIKLALKDPVPQAPVQAAPAMSDTVTTPAPAARPAKRDRN